MSDKQSLKWYIDRLSAMPYKEIVLRIKRKLAEPFVCKAIKNEKLPFSPAEILSSANTFIAARPIEPDKIQIDNAYLNEIIENADNVCNGKITLFNKQLKLDNPVNWFLDYANNVECPRINTSKINYRKCERGGDIMYIWWLNRHQHLMPAAIAYFSTKNQKYADFIIEQLQSWLNDCPYPIGPAWSTGIEAGIRLITWSWLFRFLFANGRPDNCSDEFLAAWMLSIRQHVHYIDTHWAKYSSANNHIIAEAVGVLAAAGTWSQLFPDKDYKKICRNIIIKETNRQFSYDGVNREQSTSYHAFVLELLINAYHFDNTIKKDVLNEIEKMALFLDSIEINSTTFPEIGDSDSAVASGIIPRSKKYYSDIANVARSIANSEKLNSIQVISNPVEFYCGTDIFPKQAGSSIYFEDGGYAIWKTQLDSDIKINLCMNLANLGYGNIAAHGHADALSFTLAINEEPVLIDPGTYAYHTQKKWRDYFKGTRAHNTLMINGLDQAVIKGPFLWSDKYYVHTDHVVMSTDQLDIKAEHDGYYRDEMVLSHRRELAWHPMLRKWIIRDELVGNGTYDTELFFHIHPDRNVFKESLHLFKITGTGYNLFIKFSSHFKTRIAKGETDPPMGWFSPVLGEKIPSPTIVAKGRNIGFDNIFTEFFIEKT